MIVFVMTMFLYRFQSFWKVLLVVMDKSHLHLNRATIDRNLRISIRVYIGLDISLGLPTHQRKAGRLAQPKGMLPGDLHFH
jgi:hypothetical protein